MRMKIIVGCSSPPDRGSGILTYSKELSESLIRLGIEVHFFSPTPKDWAWLLKFGIRHVSTDQQDDQIQLAANVLNYIKDQGISGVINNDNSLLQSISPGLRCPFIAIGHLGQTSIASLACHESSWSDYVVAISNDMQNTFVNKFAVPIVKCPIIYNGIHDQGRDGELIREDRTGLRVVYAGGFNRLKGADLLFKAIRNPEEWRGIELDWFGSIPPKIAKRMAQFPHVRLHGHVEREKFLPIFRSADVLLFPSRVEGCPMTILEAMSLRVVPIASDGIGAMRWMITSGQEGYICYLTNWPNHMMSCLAHLRDHPHILNEMKRRVRARYLKEFQSEGVATKLLHLLKNPTVDRTRPMKRFKILRWHRPFHDAGSKASLVERFNFRFGRLKYVGIVGEGEDGIN